MKTIDEEILSKFKSEQHRALVNLKFTSNWMSNMQNNFMMQYDLSMAQFNILRILRGAKDFISVNAVKERMIEKSPNTTRLMDKLLDKKLIERERCKNDRRVVYVKISVDGLELLAKIDECFHDNFFFAKELTDEEAKQLSYLLDKLRS